MNFVVVVVFLSLCWTAVTGSFTVPNLALGALIGSLAAWFIRERIEQAGHVRRLGRIVALMALFVSELALSAWRVAVLVVSPRMSSRIAPGIIAYPLTVTTDGQITLLANLITLTPGTLSVDVSADRRLLYIHVLEMHDRDAIIASIRDGFEARVLEVFS